MGTNGRTENSSYSRITFYILAVVLFFSPMFQGLFFRHEIYRTGLVVAALFIWYLWSSRETLVGNFKKLTSLDIGIFGLLFAYVASTFTSVKVLDAVDMDLKIAIYLMVYIIAVGLSANQVTSRNILNVIYSAGVVVSVIGLAAFAGADINGGLIGGRISSTFQYPNALGGYLGAIGIIGTYLMVTAEKPIYRHSLATGNLLIFTTMFGTSSRGTFIALALAYLIFIVFQPAAYRLRVFGTLMLNLGFGGVTGYLIEGRAGSNLVWGFVAVMAIVSIAVSVVLSKWGNARVFANKKVIWATLLIVLTVALAGSFLLIDEGFVNRITDINLKDRNVVERGYFYLDAFKIIKDNPAFGVGGGGWRSIYKAYQSYGYISTQVHNFYIQTWVEAGIVGLISIVLIILGVFQAFIRKIRDGSEHHRALAVTVMGSILVIAVQSSIDFTLSYGAIGILLWTMFGIMRSPWGEAVTAKTTTNGSPGRIPRFGLIMGTTVGLTVILFCSSLITGFIYEEKAMEALKNKDFDKRYEYLTKSTVFNPFYADNYANLALMEKAKFRKDKKPEQLKSVLYYSNKAVVSDQGNLAYRVERINALFALEDYNSVLKDAEASSRLAPWDQDSYNLLAYTYLSTGKYYLKKGDKQQAKEYFDKTMNVPKMIKWQMGKLTAEERKVWVTQKPTFDSELQRYVGQAVLLIEEEIKK